MKFKFIHPYATADRDYGKSKNSDKIKKSICLAGLTVHYLAGLTSPDIDVSVTDEMVENIDFDEEIDLVMITALTFQANRAYEIADEYRKRKTKVIMGGFHASVLPYEALQHVDSVAIGEVENVWGKIIQDFKYGTLQKIYQSTPSDLKNLPYARRDLIKKDRYIVSDSVIATRGCNYGCDFCALSSVYGRGQRVRPIDEVINEVKTLQDKVIMFWDDDITSNHEYAKELFRKLIPLKKKWGGQSTALISTDDELVSLAAKSGCIALWLGFESFSKESLREVNKFHNLTKDYKTVVQKLHNHGIGVMAGVVFGFDNDDKYIFERTIEALNKIKVDIAGFNILVPLPGTKLFKKLEEENRLLTKNWSRYSTYYPVFKPKQMSPEELFYGWLWASLEFYSYGSTLKRAFNRLLEGRFPSFKLSLIANFSFRPAIYRRLIDGIMVEEKTSMEDIKKFINL